VDPSVHSSFDSFKFTDYSHGYFMNNHVDPSVHSSFDSFKFTDYSYGYFMNNHVDPSVHSSFDSFKLIFVLIKIKGNRKPRTACRIISRTKQSGEYAAGPRGLRISAISRRYSAIPNLRSQGDRTQTPVETKGLGIPTWKLLCKTVRYVLLTFLIQR
jgi:hypothetical protein